VEAVAQLIRQAKDAGFRQVVILGGEPLIHGARDHLLAVLHKARVWTAPMNVVLRTNLAMPLGDNDLLGIEAAVDQVVVSVDGSQQTHDARRGEGSYAAAVTNMQRYVELASDMHNAAELSLAMVANSADISGDPGNAVRQLATRLGIHRVRFRPVLPLGRAADWGEPPQPELLGTHADLIELTREEFQPVATCGLGQSLNVDPSGDSYPCYVLLQRHSFLGNVIKEGLGPVLNSTSFRSLCGHSVDSNPKCRVCDVRYLCGGACRVWGGVAAQYDLDAPAIQCEGLYHRATRLFAAALDFLGIELSENWPCSTR
jgi:uncharacterized protein